mmetsp:Transcript_13132/g.13714  ORF Transcript_13132/g.13714 Transcript_13132/m.13714 type:complete len:462 (+) Transcript_13132:27-1412(+)|eukprot:CAMPEP_0170518214 /NCGR_PEP_ID=MMETSP0209-20121228/3955_1 /TAXON_ID=665100 ORGANISM="Litonotus pictus, Strain P1" /NCGR_SAMPLE_ID=MMETSP0209 /ASSEMBLY_ACC=CAM_ASM_000301 /LENGTH=461 /DNA_ID=CAMNT_0010803685 /DNA_START=9 /DNA_END=1394 /DNA_ORIENTATION=+
MRKIISKSTKAKYNKNNILTTTENYDKFKPKQLSQVQEGSSDSFSGNDGLNKDKQEGPGFNRKSNVIPLSQVMVGAKKSHILNILNTYETNSSAQGSNTSLDYFMKKYFISHKSIDYRDRDFIYEQVYFITRNKLFLDVISGNKLAINWNSRMDSYMNRDYFLTQRQNINLPLNVKESFPIELFKLLKENFGDNRVESILKVLNERAPLTVRANLIKCSREDLLVLLRKEGFRVEPTKYSPYGVTFLSRPKTNFANIRIFNDGFFEVQDEASQLAALRVKAKPGDIILDYCSGSGGKTLAFAPFTQNKGQIFLHDIRKNILIEAKKRLKRANIQNFQLFGDKSLLHNAVAGKCDWVLLDVPCSGTGAMRRNPENKYSFSLEQLKSLREKQSEILEEALLYVKPEKGKIVYTTCSILHEENLSQVMKFCGKHNWKIENETVFETTPKSGGMDGLFSATLVKH